MPTSDNTDFYLPGWDSPTRWKYHLNQVAEQIGQQAVLEIIQENGSNWWKRRSRKNKALWEALTPWSVQSLEAPLTNHPWMVTLSDSDTWPDHESVGSQTLVTAVALPTQNRQQTAVLFHCGARPLDHWTGSILNNFDSPEDIHLWSYRKTLPIRGELEAAKALAALVAAYPDIISENANPKWAHERLTLAWNIFQRGETLPPVLPGAPRVNLDYSWIPFQ